MQPLSEWEKKHFYRLRGFEASREIGVLLMAFTPLDGTISEQPFRESWYTLTSLILIGLGLFLNGVIGERRLRDAR